MSSTSAGEMFLGALVPGLVLVGVYILFIAILAFLKPSVAPAVPYHGKYDARFAGRVAMTLIPPLALIFIVLGSIIMGIATVNQAGAIGAAGAMIMAGYRLYEGRRGAYWPAILAFISVATVLAVTQVHPINIKSIVTSDDVLWLVTALISVAGLLFALIWSGLRAYAVDDTLRGVMVETAKTTSLVFIILLGAAMLTAAFRAFGGEDLVKDFLTTLPGGFWVQFFMVMAVIFVLGFFLDFIEISVVVVPIVAPILLADPSANITAVWLGVMIGLNIQTSFLTPPFGFALFYLRGVAPAAVRTLSMYKGVIAFILMQLLALGVVAYNPRLVNYLPQRILLTSDVAPPPVNPRLQLCMEKIVFDEYVSNGTEIGNAISRARQLDLGSLPAKLQKAVGASFDKAQMTFILIENISKAQLTIDAQTAVYRPLHTRVRRAQADMRRIDRNIGELRIDLGRLPADASFRGRKETMEATISKLQADRITLEASIPEAWVVEQKKYSDLLIAEQTTRTRYRRNVDDAYEPVREAVVTIAAASQLAALRDDIEGLRGIISSRPPEEAVAKIANLLAKIGRVAGARALRTGISKVRRALRGRSPDPAKALKTLDQVQKLYEEDLAWRQRAEQNVLPGLSAYEAAIRGTIGLRQQPDLPKEQAISIAGCLAYHRDISLYF